MERLSDKDYFAFKGLSKSQIKKWDDRNPMEFWRNCVFNPKRIDEGVTDALVNGRLAHTLLLEPEKFVSEYKLIPDQKGFSSRKTKAFQEAIAKENEKDLVLQSEYEQWMNRIETLKSYPLIKSILKGIQIEKPIIWEEDGLVLKAKLDAVKNTEQGIVLIEYKTTGYLDKNIRGIDIAGYIFDVGMQYKAIKALYGKEPVKMLFIMQSSKPNEENMIDIRSVSSEDMNTCVVYTDMIINKIKSKLKIAKELIDSGKNGDVAFMTELKERTFEGYADTSFSIFFDKKMAEMGE